MLQPFPSFYHLHHIHHLLNYIEWLYHSFAILGTLGMKRKHTLVVRYSWTTLHTHTHTLSHRSNLVLVNGEKGGNQRTQRKAIQTLDLWSGTTVLLYRVYLYSESGGISTGTICIFYKRSTPNQSSRQGFNQHYMHNGCLKFTWMYLIWIINSTSLLRRVWTPADILVIPCECTSYELISQVGFDYQSHVYL